MIDTIYVEHGVEHEARAARLLQRFPRATVIGCERYTQVFNPAAQSFRLQKRRPALILARKQGRRVLEAPAGFGIGEGPAFYFSHLLNCPYDCRYCFLQGMFRSAHLVHFVNYEDFQRAIDDTRARHAGARCTFFSGYDCDSLALEGITGFAAEFVPFFARRSDAVLELRTKSVATGALLRLQPAANVVVAFSLTPAGAAAAVEHGAPPVAARIDALAELAAAGWPVAVRLDPLLWYDGWRRGYVELIDRLAAALRRDALHSISIGPLRFPRAMLHRIASMYPDDALLAGPLQGRGALASYGREREAELAGVLGERLAAAFPGVAVFTCAADAA